jgi:HK97 family phage prohead protease
MEQRKIPAALAIRAEVSAKTYKEDERTVEVTFATDTPVTRLNWDDWEYFDEVLDFAPGSVRLDRINASAPVLKDHRNSVDSVVGVVERAWIESGQGRAIIRLSESEDAADIRAKVKEGVLRNVSVGYRVHKYERQPKADGQARPIYRAIDWEPAEISLVGVPADHKSQLRGEGDDSYSVTIIERTMSKDPQNTPPAGEATPPAPQPDLEAIRKEVESAALKRAADIAEICRKANLDLEFAQNLIKEGKTVEEARAAAFDKVTENLSTRGITGQQPSGSGHFKFGPAEEDKRREAVETAIMLRAGSVKDKDVKAEVLAHARNYRNMTFLQLAEDCLLRGGDNYASLRSMSNMELVGRAFTSSTSDFSILLEGTARRTLLAAYERQAYTWRRFCDVGTASDFREYQQLRTGALGNLTRNAENEEHKTIPLSDAERERYSLETWSGLINISRKMIINDDLNGFSRLISDLGLSSARTVETEVFRNLALNNYNGPNLSDGNPIFHNRGANKNNILGAGALTVAQMDLLRQRFLEFKDPNGKDFIVITPEILLVAPNQLWTARQLNEQQYDPQDAARDMKPNLAAGMFRDIVDSPYLPGSAKVAYAFANPALHAVMQVTFLNGVQEPMIETQRGWNIEGVEMKALMDFGVDGVGYRGAVKIPLP